MHNISLEVHKAKCLWELGQRMLGPILAWSFVVAFVCQNSFMEMKAGRTQLLPDEGWPTGRMNWCPNCEARKSLSMLPFSCDIFHFIFSCCYYSNLSHALPEWRERPWAQWSQGCDPKHTYLEVSATEYSRPTSESRTRSNGFKRVDFCWMSGRNS